MPIRTTILVCFALSTAIAPAVRAQQSAEFTNIDTIEITSPSEDDPTVVAGVASSYPSSIVVSGFGPQETISTVTVTLYDLEHSFPDDIDILLVGPEGQTLVLFSDACGDVWNADAPLTITLDDNAPERLPDDDPIELGGAYLPTNYEVGPDDDADVFPSVDRNGLPAPHPEPSFATRLAVFRGTRPNGQWHLYVVDDDVDDDGTIAGGWSLWISTETKPPLFRRGDADADNTVNLTDAVMTLNALFQGGPQPPCADAGDADDDGSVSVTDAVFTLNYLFQGGPVPTTPGPGNCGVDPTTDPLGCEAGQSCRECPGDGQQLCNGVCIDTNWDSGNCGGCGIVCPEGFACSAGVCEGSP